MAGNSDDFCESSSPASGGRINWALLGSFTLGDRVLAGAAEAVAELRQLGIESVLLSGDNEGAARKVAQAVGIDRVIAQASPQEKAAEIARMKETGAIVAMVGDGINDAPVLAAADVAIALSSGAAIAQAASGLVLAAERLDELPRVRVVARRMHAVLHQNLNWALGYNLAVVPLAAFGLVPPWLAAIGMSASSLVVVLNSLRIGATREEATQPQAAARLAGAAA